MIAEATIALGDEQPVLRIPRQAALEEFDLTYVYAVDEDNENPGHPVARRRRVIVRPVPFLPGELEVISGLEAGEVIVASGVRNLREGLHLSLDGQP